jgi:hypothetical protein
MRRSPSFIVMLLVIVACNSLDASLPRQTLPPTARPTGTRTKTDAQTTAIATLQAAAATALPTQLAGATTLPAESPWSNANAAELARTFAARIADAQSDPARQAALLQVMRALDVGVYTVNGDAVLRGAERGPHDFYLYDFELGMTATSLGRQDAWSLADLTATLNEMGIRPDDKPLTYEPFTSVLLAAVREASQTPADRLSLPLLLVRELGLRQPTAYDLLKEPKQGALSFSALQKFLITIDIVLPIVREAKFTSGPSRLAAESNGVLQLKPVSYQSSVCDSMVGTVVKEGWGAGKLFLGLALALKKKFNPAVLGLVSIDGIHGMMMAVSVKVKELDNRLETHYGHEVPGKEIQFRFSVEMLDQLPEVLIKCGWLLGVEFPNKGGIPGVKMLWLTGPLNDHGTVSCEARCKETGPDGIATLSFQPKSELPFYGLPLETHETGTVFAAALYQSRLKNYLGSVAQIISPKWGSKRWFVDYHPQPDLELRFDSKIDGTDQLFWATTNAHARIRLKYDAAEGWNGTGGTNYVTQAKPHTNPGLCELAFNGNETTSSIVRKSQVTGGNKPSIVIGFLPGVSHVTVTEYERVHGRGECMPTKGPLPRWGGFSEMWLVSHYETFERAPCFCYRIRDWEIVQTGSTIQTGLFARKTLNGNCPGSRGNCTETTKLELYVLPWTFAKP